MKTTTMKRIILAPVRQAPCVRKKIPVPMPCNGGRKHVLKPVPKSSGSKPIRVPSIGNKPKLRIVPKRMAKVCQKRNGRERGVKSWVKKQAHPVLNRSDVNGLSHFLQQANVIASRMKAKTTENTHTMHGKFITTLEWRFHEPGKRPQVWKVRGTGCGKKNSRGMAAKKMLEDHGLAPKLSVQELARIDEVKRLCGRDLLDIRKINDAIKALPPDAYELFLVDAFRAAISQNCAQQLILPQHMPCKTWSEMLNEATFIMEHDVLSPLKNVQITGNFDEEVSRLYYLKYRFLVASERRAQLRQALEGRNEDEFQKLEWREMRVADRNVEYFTLQPISGLMPDVVDGDVVVVTAPSIQRPFLCKVTSKASKGRGPPKITVKALRQQKFTTSCVSIANLEGEVTAMRQIEALDAFAGPRDPRTVAKSRFNFNPAMRSALLHVENSDPGRIGIVHGPPGAGKTYTACEIVKNWLSTPERPKILCVTDSNAAADNLHAALKSAGTRAVRFQKDPTDECSIARSYNEWVETKDIYMRIKTWRETLERFPVVVTTCSSAGHQAFDNMIFDALILDEATQSTEPSSLVPYGRSVRQSVLIGDPKQLPPTVFETPDLQVTLFDRVDKAQRQESKMFLEEQRRMHPEIMAFPSRQFYDDRLKANIDPPIPIGWPAGAKRVIFREVSSREESRKSSKCNLTEIDAITDEVRRLVKADTGNKQTIAVITPYVAQKQQLRRALGSFDNVVVNTIDGYQGNEADVVLFSSVRSEKLGFTDDPRRINVALTRAKRGLIVFGRRETFNMSRIWREWVRWIDELNGIAVPARRLIQKKRPSYREFCSATNEEVTAVADKLFHATVHHTKDWVDDQPGDDLDWRSSDWKANTNWGATSSEGVRNQLVRGNEVAANTNWGAASSEGVRNQLVRGNEVAANRNVRGRYDRRDQHLHDASSKAPVDTSIKTLVPTGNATFHGKWNQYGTVASAKREDQNNDKRDMRDRNQWSANDKRDLRDGNDRNQWSANDKRDWDGSDRNQWRTDRGNTPICSDRNQWHPDRKDAPGRSDRNQWHPDRKDALEGTWSSANEWNEKR